MGDTDDSWEPSDGGGHWDDDPASVDSGTDGRFLDSWEEAKIVQPAIVYGEAAQNIPVSKNTLIHSSEQTSFSGGTKRKLQGLHGKQAIQPNIPSNTIS